MVLDPGQVSSPLHADHSLTLPKTCYSCCEITLLSTRLLCCPCWVSKMYLTSVLVAGCGACDGACIFACSLHVLCPSKVLLLFRLPSRCHLSGRVHGSSVDAQLACSAIVVVTMRCSVPVVLALGPVCHLTGLTCCEVGQLSPSLQLQPVLPRIMNISGLMCRVYTREKRKKKKLGFVIFLNSVCSHMVL